MVTSEKQVQVVWSALANVVDPEIPVLSIVDLGMVNTVEFMETGELYVTLLPTFVGCPAVGLIGRQVEKALSALPDTPGVTVKFVYDPPWTSDRMTERGKEALASFGIAPPRCSLQSQALFTASCPYCQSENTRLHSLFGPTACRSVFMCEDCRQMFEAMKPV